MSKYAEMSRKDLIAAAKKIGITKAQSTKSVELITALEEHEAAETAKAAEQTEPAEITETVETTETTEITEAVETAEVTEITETAESTEAEKESASGNELVVVIRNWTKVDGKWQDEGFSTAKFIGETKTDIIKRYRAGNHGDICNSPVAVFSRKDYEKFLTGAAKSNKDLDSDFVRAEVGKYFRA